MIKRVFRFLYLMGMLTLCGILVAAFAIFFIFSTYGSDLPDYRQLKNYQPPVVTRMYAADGRLLKQFATENRVFVPIEFIPKNIIKAVLAAEDKNFYQHKGVDYIGILRAVFQNVNNVLQDRRLVGASTITQQVAKNFLLGNEKSLNRKIKEAILAFRMERTFTKDEILELYLNEIYLGYNSYGVAAAGLNYFNKSLDELSLAESAYLAALPKGPNNYHPINRPEAAIARRNWVLSRMYEERFISKDEMKEAQIQPLSVYATDEAATASADYFVEEARRMIMNRYGEDALYRGGLYVRTSVDPELQNYATEALRNGLIAYDRRHGWRGAVKRLDMNSNWQGELAGLRQPGALPDWSMAIALAVDANGAMLALESGKSGRIPLSELRWARDWKPGEYLGPAINKASDVLEVGDVIYVERLPEQAQTGGKHTLYGLRQIPAVNGGLVAMDPHTGRVLAMSGGFSFDESEFNRATQAERQTGSAFKPFVYMSALDSGFTPATQILDAPFVIDQGGGLGKWSPDNYSKEFYGPVPLRKGIELSRNLMTVRLANAVGMEKVVDYAKKFGIVDSMEPVLAMSLGSKETTLLRLTGAYAMIANGGRRVEPILIDRIQDRSGKTIFRHDERPCPDCRVEWQEGLPVPKVEDEREQVVDPITAYQMISILEGVVQRGTGRRIAALGRPLAGKTGTTNDSFDTWFMGFSPDLVVGVFVGFDTPRSLGKRETGANVSAPIFAEFMSKALEGKPATPFRVPSGVRFVRIDSETGHLATAESTHTILEAFHPGTEPTPFDRAVPGFSDPRGGVGEDSGLQGLY